MDSVPGASQHMAFLLQRSEALQYFHRNDPLFRNMVTAGYEAENMLVPLLSMIAQLQAEFIQKKATEPSNYVVYGREAELLQRIDELRAALVSRDKTEAALRKRIHEYEEGMDNA